MTSTQMRKVEGISIFGVLLNLVFSVLIFPILFGFYTVLYDQRLKSRSSFSVYRLGRKNMH